MTPVAPGEEAAQDVDYEEEGEGEEELLDIEDDEFAIDYVIPVNPNAEYIMVDRDDLHYNNIFGLGRTLQIVPSPQRIPMIPRIPNPRTCKSMALDWQCGYW